MTDQNMFISFSIHAFSKLVRGLLQTKEVAKLGNNIGINLGDICVQF